MTNTLIPWKRNLAQRSTNAGAGAVTQLRSDWDRMFDRLLDDFWGPSAGASQGLPLDMIETDEEVRIRAEVPGIAPKDLDISLAGEVLTLSGQKLDEQEGQTAQRLYSERYFGTFQRSLRLPCPVDADTVQAEHKHGVVTIILQKAEVVRPKRIKVQAS